MRKLLVILLLLVSARGMAQFVNADYPSIEAYINDNRVQGSLLLARSLAEVANNDLLSKVRGSTKDYKEINVSLDKYRRAFDIIDLVLASLKTTFNFVNTYNSVSADFTAWQGCINKFNSACLSRDKLKEEDLLIIHWASEAVADGSSEIGNIILAVADLAMYCGGKITCTTHDITLIVWRINDALDRLAATVHTGYVLTAQYISERTAFWKEGIYRLKSKGEICNESMGRWKTGYSTVGTSK